MKYRISKPFRKGPTLILSSRYLLQRLAPGLAAAFLAIGGSPTALAADRHVLLDTDGDGTLNDCPNPAHNAKGTSNTDDLLYCQGGSVGGRVIGTAAGRVTASACTGAGGTVKGVVNGVTIDLDGDGTLEAVYGHPQACVYNMAKSDSCEVHAGTYRKPGAQCTSSCGDVSRAGVGAGVCADWNCFLASVLAFGYGPNLDGTGYGTKTDPGYLRGAVMNGSTDTWDADGDKVPDTEPGETRGYPAILSGDTNGDGSFQITSCTGTSCTGDAFAAIHVGCGAESSSGYNILCSTTFMASEHGPSIDTDANGSFDTEIGRLGTREVHYLVIKDLALSGYNGGNGSSDQTARYKEAHINLNGDGSTNGLRLDHLWIHGNDYKYPAGSNETFWAAIADLKNAGCQDPHYTEVARSLIEQNNQMVFDDDGGVGAQLGCGFSIHDNRIIVNVTSPRSGQGGPVNAPANVIGYFKNIDRHIDGTKKVHRFWNNEVVYKNGGAGPSWLFDVQAFGNANSTGLGEMWVYGNLFRYDPVVANKLQLFFPKWCGTGTGSWRWYWFNNTVDGGSSATAIEMSRVCDNTGGEIYVGTNNVETFTNNEEITAAATLHVSHNRSDDANRCSGSSQLFACGVTPTVYTGPAFYTARTGGGLAGTGTCDPDQDGAAGVDYDGDGVNDTTWRDLQGNTVSCPSLTATMDAGAIQSGGGGTSDTTPPGTVQGLRRTDTKPVP